jgi:hypothetical protein
VRDRLVVLGLKQNVEFYADDLYVNQPYRIDEVAKPATKQNK